MIDLYNGMSYKYRYFVPDAGVWCFPSYLRRVQDSKMSELVVSVALVFVFAAHVFWFQKCTGTSWGVAVAYSIAGDVSWMSHLWHILYGEDRIGTCPERREDEVFGWTPCFTSEWNTYVNTYEITLAAEFIILSSFAYYVIYKTCEMVRVSGYTQVIIYVLNTLNLVFAIILLFSSPKFLDGFKDVFTVTGFVCSLALAGVLEIVSRRETRVLL